MVFHLVRGVLFPVRPHPPPKASSSLLKGNLHNFLCLPSDFCPQSLNPRLPTLAPKLAATPKIWVRRPEVGDGIPNFGEWVFTEPGQLPMPGLLHPPTLSQSEIREERGEWVEKTQKICQSRDTAKAELWLSTAGQWKRIKGRGQLS